jgi:hypothetical protein
LRFFAQAQTERRMKVKLQINKAVASIYEGAYDISDAESFGKACTDAWAQLVQRRMGQGDQHWRTL